MEQQRILHLESLEERTVPAGNVLSPDLSLGDQTLVQSSDASGSSDQDRSDRSGSSRDGRQSLRVGDAVATDMTSASIRGQALQASALDVGVASTTASALRSNAWMSQYVMNAQEQAATRVQATSIAFANLAVEVATLPMVQVTPMPMDVFRMETTSRWSDFFEQDDSRSTSREVELTDDLPELRTELLPGVHPESELSSGVFVMPWESDRLLSRPETVKKSPSEPDERPVVHPADEIVGLGEQQKAPESQSDHEQEPTPPTNNSEEASPMDLFWQEVRRSIFVLPFMK